MNYTGHTHGNWNKWSNYYGFRTIVLWHKLFQSRGKMSPIGVILLGPVFRNRNTLLANSNASSLKFKGVTTWLFDSGQCRWFYQVRHDAPGWFCRNIPKAALTSKYAPGLFLLDAASSCTEQFEPVQEVRHRNCIEYLLRFLSTVIKNRCAYSWLSIKTDKKKERKHVTL